MTPRSENGHPHDRPSDICLVLATLHNRWDGSVGRLTADEVRGTLKTFGFDCSTQQVAAWLGSTAKLEAAPIDVDRDGFVNFYRVNHFGETWLHNKLGDIWWAQARSRDRLELEIRKQNDGHGLWKVGR